MRRLYPLYTLALALLVGGGALYTFVVTPVIFARFERDLAGRVVGATMPGYFAWGVATVLVAGLVFLLAASNRGGRAFRISVGLLAVALATAAAVAFWVYPAIVEVRAQVASFAADAPVTAARAEFRRLHGVSSVLNVVLLGIGTALLLLAPRHAAPGPETRSP